MHPLMKKPRISMRQYLSIIKFAIFLLGILFMIVRLFIIFDSTYYHFKGKVNLELAAKFGDFIGGFIGTLFGFLSVLILAYSILRQTFENRKSNVKSSFFKMIDYHYKNVEQIELTKPGNDDVIEKGRRGFVAYKIQFKRLLQAISMINKKYEFGLKAHDIASIAYMVFYYGVDNSWEEFLKEKISCYDCREQLVKELIEMSHKNPELKLCRTNQTILSAYFRNMYNAIKLVDREDNFTKDEKYELIKIYRAQLSNPELYILFFNVISPFGKKWREMNFVKKYNLVKNIPHDYLDSYDAKKYFDITYECEDVNCATDDGEFPDEEPHEIKSSTCLDDFDKPRPHSWYMFGGIGRK